MAVHVLGHNDALRVQESQYPAGTENVSQRHILELYFRLFTDPFSHIGNHLLRFHHYFSNVLKEGMHGLSK